MIAICDNSFSEGARNLRKKLFTAGLPCACLSLDELGDCKPYKLFITYYRDFDALRHRPFDDVFAIVIGDGFVNSALNAVRVRNEDEAAVLAEQYLLKLFGISERQRMQFGIYSGKGIFYAKRYFEVYGNIVRPTVSEYMIFKYLIAFSDTAYSFDSKKIRRFCYVRDLADAGNVDGNIAAHISNLNSKLKAAYGKQLIRPRRSKGYYFDLKRL